MRRVPGWLVGVGLVTGCAGTSDDQKADGSAATDEATDGSDGTDSETDADTDSLGPMTIALAAPVPAGDHALAAECGVKLPAVHSCEGPSPELVFTNVPTAAVSLVLIFDDPDAGNYPHWAVLNLPPATVGLAAGVSGKDLTSALPAADLFGDATVDAPIEALNGFGWKGYLGSCPGSAHVYRWRLWALDAAWEEEAPTGNAKKQFTTIADFARDHVLARAESCHIFDPEDTE